MAEWPVVDIRPDPRISSLRPAWLADDAEWRNQLQAMRLQEDIYWIEKHWESADGRGPHVDVPPFVDLSWLLTERIR